MLSAHERKIRAHSRLPGSTTDSQMSGSSVALTAVVPASTLTRSTSGAVMVLNASSSGKQAAAAALAAAVM